MIREGDITVQKAVDICRAAEATRAQLKSISSDVPAPLQTTYVTTEVEIHFIGTKPKKEATKQACARCGHKHTSNQKNHFVKICKTGSFKQHPPCVHGIECNSSDELKRSIQAGTKSKDWKATILLNRLKMRFKLDTGAQYNVISNRKYNQISSEPLRTSLYTCGKAL